MDILTTETVLHPDFLDRLFAWKNEVSGVFQDILGLHGIDHLAISHINEHYELLTFSSTPALEFNLFNGERWRADKTFHHDWYSLGTYATWESLYDPAHYDELYALKQAKNGYVLGYSLAEKRGQDYLIYSFASHVNTPHDRECFLNQLTTTNSELREPSPLTSIHQQDSFYKIGQYCMGILLPLFQRDL